MHLTAVLLGASVWGVAALVKLTPERFIHAMPEFGEDQAALDSVNTSIDQAGRRFSI